MREDFREVREELKEIGIRRIVEEHYMTPQRRTIYFVKSPASPDKTASLAIFPETNRFCDFAKMVIKAETSSRCTHMLRAVVSGKP